MVINEQAQEDYDFHVEDNNQREEFGRLARVDDYIA